MSRSFGPIVRTEKVKEPNKFFYIACEGHVTEVKYFQELNNVGELCKFIHFKRPSEERTNSSPKNVFNTLKKNVIKEGLNSLTDECWIVVDRDQWGSNLAKAVQECIRHKYKFAVSSSCLEIWFIMHLVQIDSLVEPIKKSLLKNDVFRHTDENGQEIKYQFCGSYLHFLIQTYLGPEAFYEKNKPLPKDFFELDKISFAIAQAKEIEEKISDANYLYPTNHIGSQLYQLMESFLKFNEENQR
jgi:hypothetical protein